LQLRRRSKGSGLTRGALDARLRELGVRDVDGMRARMIRLELISSSDGGALWAVINPVERMMTRMEEVKARFLIKGRLAALPSDPADRTLVLRWFTDRLDRDDTYDDAQLARLWRHAFADLSGLKQALIDAGLLVATPDGRYGLSGAETGK